MSLAQRCRHCFDQPAMDRGSRVHARHSIDILDVDPVVALVESSGDNQYEVNIELPAHGADNLLASCNCPRFKNGSLCQHIWATLLSLENADFEGLLPGDGPVEVGMDWETSWDDDDASDLLDKYGGGGLQAGLDGRGASPWINQLGFISHRTASQPSVGELWKGLASKQRQVWYVINAGVCVRRQSLVVELFQRETKKNGDWGKIKKLSARREKLDELSDSEDRRLVGMLLGNQVDQNEYTYYSRYMYSSAGSSSISVVPAMYDFVLPQLSATQRLVWLLDSSLPIEEAQRVDWDAGPPWQFRLNVESDPASKCWQLSGGFHRGAETVRLEEAVFASSDGLLLFPGRLSRFDGRQDFPWIDVLRTQHCIEVPYADRERLIQRLAALSHVPTLELPEDLHVEQVQAKPRGRLSIKAPGDGRHTSNELLAQVTFEYSGTSFCLQDEQRGFFDSQAQRFVLRCREAERALMKQLKQAGVRPIRSYYSDLADVEFHQRKLAELTRDLIQNDWIVESEGVRVRRPGSFQLSVTSNVDWFELDGRLEFDGVAASLPALLQAVRTGDGFIQLDDGSQGMLPEDWLERYGRLARLGDADGDTLRFSSSQAMLLDALLAEQENVQVDHGFEETLQKLRSFTGIQPHPEPAGFVGELRGYQREGVGWLEFLHDYKFGGCLADDMGLGKTVQVLAMLQERRLNRLNQAKPRPSIVVVPKSLIFNWMDEAERFTPELQVLNYTGAERNELLPAVPRADLVLTTYGTLRRDIVQLKDIPFDYAILDESQAIKNPNSQAAKACRLLNCDHRLAMTGTPVENHLGEVWSLFEFLNPGMLGSSSAFSGLAKGGQHDASSSLPLLAQALRPFVLRRTKEQVLSELPEKTEQTLLCEMPASQRKLYDELREYYRAQLSDRVAQFGIKKSKIHVLEALLRLRQAACHPGLLNKEKADQPSAKLVTLLEQLDEVIAEGHKALVFSQFTSLLAIVRKQLDDRGLVYEYLDGRTRKRAERVKRFQQDPHCPLFLISLKAGGQGLNLTAADYVFILDPWWNPAVEAQAVDRAHRIGQQRRVFAYRLICRNTVEEKILELQREKRELADAIISADNSVIRDMTAEDLQLLLS